MAHLLTFSPHGGDGASFPSDVVSLIGFGTYPFLVLTAWRLTLGEIDLLEMLEAAGWGEYHAEPVIYERRHAKPGEESHLIDTRGGKGNRATSCGQSAVGPRGENVTYWPPRSRRC